MARLNNWYPSEPDGATGLDILPLANTVEQLIPPISHNGTHSKKVVDRAEAAGWEVALSPDVSTGALISGN